MWSDKGIEEVDTDFIDRDDQEWGTYAAAILSGMVARVPFNVEDADKLVDHALVIKIADDFMRHKRSVAAAALAAQQKKESKLVDAVKSSLADEDEPLSVEGATS